MISSRMCSCNCTYPALYFSGTVINPLSILINKPHPLIINFNNLCSIVGLDAAGKTTILYKLKLGEIVTTIPTIGTPLCVCVCVCVPFICAVDCFS